jgi:hypothetical protein
LLTEIPAAEVVEGRPVTKENIMMLNTCLIQLREISVPQGLCGVRGRRLTSPDVMTYRASIQGKNRMQ